MTPDYAVDSVGEQEHGRQAYEQENRNGPDKCFENVGSLNRISAYLLE